MKTAIVHDYLPAIGGGGERSLRMFIDHFAPQVDVYFGFVVDSPYSRTTLAELRKSLGSEHVHTGPLVKQPREFWFRIMNFMLTALLQQYNFTDYDLVISHTAFLGHSIVPPISGRHILYTMTPARFLWNLPHTSSILKRLSAVLLVTDLMKFRAQLYDLSSAEKVPTIWANSQATAQRVASFYNRSAAVLYPPAIQEELLAQYPVDATLLSDFGSYFTHVSRIDSYKNIDLLLSAYETHNISEISIIMGDGHHLKSLKKRATARFGPSHHIMLRFDNGQTHRALQSGKIIFTGNIQEDLKFRIIASASAQFSLNDEDFGITKVEALAMGTPVIALNAGAAAEVVNNGVTGVLFSDNTPQSLIEAIQQHRMLTYDKSKLIQFAKQFTIEQFHHKLDQLLHA